MSRRGFHDPWWKASPSTPGEVLRLAGPNEFLHGWPTETQSPQTRLRQLDKTNSFEDTCTLKPPILQKPPNSQGQMPKPNHAQTPRSEYSVTVFPSSPYYFIYSVVSFFPKTEAPKLKARARNTCGRRPEAAPYFAPRSAGRWSCWRVPFSLRFRGLRFRVLVI